MSNYQSKIRKSAVYAFSVIAMFFTLLGANSASAASLGGSGVAVSIQKAVVDGQASIGLTRVHHKRWRRGRFSIYIGTPYVGYYYGRHYRYCRRWRRRCAYRHGWKTRMWRRCVRYHGCRRYY